MVRFVAITILVVGLVNLVVAVWTSNGGSNIYGSDAGGDYSNFYVAGTILNGHPPDRLYDFELQSRLQHDFQPAGHELAFLNPPFLAVLFRPLAILPYTASYLAWIVVSTALYIAGFVLIRKTLHAVPPGATTIWLLLALSFAPFLFECAIGGNLSALGFFAISLALYFERLGRHPASGMALALCLYRPTLLILVLPMLVIARRFRTLSGLVAGGLLLAGASLVAVGWQTCVDYLQILFRVSRATSGSEEFFRTWKYVDLLSFFRLLAGRPTQLTWICILVAVLASIPFLVKAWCNLDRHGEARAGLVWAGTLTWTTVFNLHLGIYDTIIVVPAMMLTADALYRNSPDTARALTTPFRWLVALLYFAPWISQHVARLLGFQAFTLILAATGAYQLFLAISRGAGAVEERSAGVPDVRTCSPP